MGLDMQLSEHTTGAIAAIQSLIPGDLVQIQCPSPWHDDAFASSRWMSARVIDCEVDAWPLVQFADGQLTEVRPFMHFRLKHSALAEAA